jgi:hypothetical protein
VKLWPPSLETAIEIDARANWQSNGSVLGTNVGPGRSVSQPPVGMYRRW